MIETNMRAYVYHYNGEEKEVHIRRWAEFGDLCKGVVAIRNAVFADSQYRPYVKSCIMLNCYLILYTDIEAMTPDMAYRYVLHSDLLSVILSVIDSGQAQDFERWVDEMIEWEKGRKDMDRLMSELTQTAKANNKVTEDSIPAQGGKESGEGKVE